MDNKKPTLNYAKAKIENKQNSQQDYTVEFGKENTFDQINLTHSESSKNTQPRSKKKDTEFGEEDTVDRNNKMNESRNKKNNRHGNQNRENKN